ncbi:MAG: SUMF1/EgtB/PvdO family nonheme iron enzyme, partial [Myxococcales bacterium]|nr:SUMF1/EgtB/PvdO family nonheme iron enzyme [Myxococcales bacterium]
DAAARHREALAHHDDGRHARWLEGTATLRLATRPAGATATIRAWQIRDRQRLLGDPVYTGPAAGDVALPAGNYLIELGFPGRPPVRHGVRLARLGDHVADVFLPTAVAEGAVYIPAGPCTIGGDPQAPDAFPATLVEVPGFAADRFPVTNAQFLAFLNALVDAGQADEALRHAPRQFVGGQSGVLYPRDDDGHFGLGADSDGTVWRPDDPVVQVSWHGAMAYAAWRAARTGHAWRLLHEVEWEKAARGVDGRAYPWGDAFDPVFAASLHSLPGPPLRQLVHAFPTDESPYGLRGLGGNVRDWCLNAWADERPAGLLEVATPAAGDDRLRATRGGSYVSLAPMCRAATRFAAPPGAHYGSVGFRLGYSLP